MLREIITGLWTGSAEDKTAMRELGCVVVDLRNPECGDTANTGDLAFPLCDGGEDQDSMIFLAADNVRSLLGKGVKVGVHCAAGVSRTGAVVELAVFLIELDKAHGDKSVAWREMHRIIMGERAGAGFVVHPALASSVTRLVYGLADGDIC